MKRSFKSLFFPGEFIKSTSEPEDFLNEQWNL